MTTDHPSRKIPFWLWSLCFVLFFGSISTISLWKHLPRPFPALLTILMIASNLVLMSNYLQSVKAERQFEAKLKKLGAKFGTEDRELLEKIAYGYVDVGMSHEHVEASIGPPDDITGDSTEATLIFDHGDWRQLIVLTHGVVSDVAGDCLLTQRDEAIRCRESGDGFPWWLLE